VDAIITIDETGVIHSANPATERLFGFKTDELAGNNVSMLMPSPEREKHDDCIAAYLKTGQKKVIGIGRDVIGQRKDGSTFSLHLTISETRLSDRRLFTGILRDITDLMTVQEELKNSLARVRKGRDNQRAILDQLRIGSAVLDTSGDVQYLSASCRRMLGVQHALEDKVSWETLCPFGASVKEQLRAAMKKPPSERERIVAQVEASDGQRFWMDVEIHDDPRDQGGRILAMYDMTEIHDLRLQLEEHATYHDMVGKSEPMRQVFHAINDLAKVDVTVLIEGETGTGKEMVAQAIHASSPRGGKPFVAVNCAALTDPLLSSQLFGHRRGAFTGAIKDQPGIFERAEGGTVFLDEIGDVSPEVQKALLRVLQQREITPVGDSLPREIDVRVIAATHRDLQAEVSAGRFREDLFYRVRVAPISLPPLRDRRTDIPLLAATFLRKAATASEKPINSISTDANAALINYSWPGNVRELQNAIEVAVVRCRTEELLWRDLPPEVSARDFEIDVAGDPVEVDRQRIRAALEAARGNRAAAARNLGMSRATFYRRLTELGIAPK
jgi:PAS domain S-box-containing protein